ncbi:MAG: hypothetical protein HN729_07180 [Candidatus Marinimicrobia bacterium]|jgi:nitrate reductase delta subunit|nr:hypothetical protein [Candidatus Neomarinimicrobiota bacterium]MBT3633593.1 hypothetical protein [Candidatus Neomarinimicrobiota bacterium]MBT3682454.1 hypothetical protein [Candidatus Neomarinimicrobiota bacterium]MBT3759218.1 hypothetical protein [Candidatus Neomarinimicrobiota bacterium]MBT3895509.1 hypothetical protein [Candidatus Neomarinimicrobiota bacterium]
MMVADVTVKNEILGLFAQLLSYPGESYKSSCAQLQNYLSDYPEEKQHFDKFADFILDSKLSKIEELYTVSFDMNPSTCFEIGWHLYGEAYQRGEFLVKVRVLLRKDNIKESVELPDHISHCLLVLYLSKNEKDKNFVGYSTCKGLDKILESLDKENPYYHALITLSNILTKQFKFSEEPHGQL